MVSLRFSSLISTVWPRFVDVFVKFLANFFCCLFVDFYVENIHVQLPYKSFYSLTCPRFESKYNKNDKGSHFGLDPNNSWSKTRQNSRHKSQQKDDKNLSNKVGRKVDMRQEKGRETMALTGLRRNGITRRAY